MSVEAQELMVDEWTRWQGHLVGGIYPLGRILGCSEHSGVFLTKSPDAPSREVALKLVPASAAADALQLPRWTRVSDLAHPHLLPLLASGTCELEGLPYLYVVMEYADQTLAQLLLRRALSAEEAREMLLPVLDALSYLHAQGLIHGQLKPTNVLVVGDQLKLASDTIRRVGEERLLTPTAYDPPKGLDRGNAPADDVWAIGVSLFEALTRRSPFSGQHRNSPVLPADFPIDFRDIVTRCLSPRTQDRPAVIELQAWAGGQPVPPLQSTQRAPALPAAEAAAAPSSPVPPTVPSPRIVDAARPAAAKARSPKRAIAAMIAAAVVLALGWTVIPALRAHRTPEPVAAGAADELQSLTAGGTYLGAAQGRAAGTVPSPTPRAGNDPAQFAVLHQEIPAVAKSAARTIRGHVEVSVRAVIRPDGSVSSVVADRGGPSKYFQRLAVDAAKKWTFAPVNDASPRRVLIQFDFNRDRTLGHSIALP